MRTIVKSCVIGVSLVAALSVVACDGDENVSPLPEATAGKAGAAGAAGGQAGQGGVPGKAGSSGQGGSATAGKAGMSGSSGQAGSAGASGNAGGSGAAGKAGASGNAGAGGGAGKAGASGSAGSAGTAGGAGSAGNAGTGGGGNGGSAGNAGMGGGGTGGNAGGGPCVHSADCSNGQLCNTLDVPNQKVVCGAAGPVVGAALTSPCTKHADCASGLCDPLSLVCTVACSGAADCGPKAACTNVPLGSAWQPGFCHLTCAHDADCPVNGVGEHACSLGQDLASDAVVFVCDSVGAAVGTKGVKGFGELVGAGDLCEYGVSEMLPGPTPAAGTYCTRACVDATDCAAPLLTCTASIFMNPSGSGTSIAKVCTP